MAMRAAVHRVLGACGLVVALASPARAQEPSSSPWQFTLTPAGLWALGISGPATVRGQTSDLDVSFSDIFDHLQGAFSVNFTATKGRVGGFLTAEYLKVGEDSIVSAVAPPVDVSLKWFTISGGPSFGVVATPEVAVSLLAGVRYSAMKGSLKATDGSFDLQSNTVDWWDPFVGAQITKPIGSRFSLAVKGDVGGFDISENTSKLTWNLFPTAAYRFAVGRRSMLVSAGYRFEHIEFTGQGPSVFQMDVDMSGPALGLTYVF